MRYAAGNERGGDLDEPFVGELVALLLRQKLVEERFRPLFSLDALVFSLDARVVALLDAIESTLEVRREWGAWRWSALHPLCPLHGELRDDAPCGLLAQQAIVRSVRIKGSSSTSSNRAGMSGPSHCGAPSGSTSPG